MAKSVESVVEETKVSCEALNCVRTMVMVSAAFVGGNVVPEVIKVVGDTALAAPFGSWVDEHGPLASVVLPGGLLDVVGVKKTFSGFFGGFLGFLEFPHQVLAMSPLRFQVR